MVENIYRHVSSGENADLPLKDRIIQACHEVERPLLFSTLIMVAAFIPLFTMTGPEGQIFGPMADTYAFALGGALLLALTVSPVLCLLLFKRLGPPRDNFLVRRLKRGYLRNLELCLDHRWVTLTLFGAIAAVTVVALRHLGGEFMPELEEGNVYVRGTFPVNVSLDEVADKARAARAIMRAYPEAALVQSQVGRPDDGTDPTGFYNAEFSVPLRPEPEWPRVVPKRYPPPAWLAGRPAPAWLPTRRWLPSWLAWADLEPTWTSLVSPKRARSKAELVRAMNDELDRAVPGVDWNFSQ